MRSVEEPAPLRLAFSRLSALPWLEAGVTTRHAEGVFPSFLGHPAAPLVTLAQRHGSRVQLVPAADAAAAAAALPEGDALITRRAGVVLAVHVADCVPVVLADAERRALGVAHCGWRGLAAGLLAATLEAMRREFGTRAGDLVAGIGPAAGPCCYVVGEDVERAFAAPERCGVFLDAGGRRRLDLWKTTSGQLMALGLRAESLETVALCTACHPELFHSRRRDGTVRGRMYGYALARAE